jgi:DNA-binding NarL/FixJ family response regulator
MTAATLLPEQHPLILSQENPEVLLAQFRLLAPQRFSKRTLHALVVEDQPFSRKMLHDALRDFGTVDPAKDAHEGVKAYLKYPPHIAFLDIGLPDGSGHAMAALIRQLDPQAFIVMVTGNNGSDDVEAAMANGVGGYIVKPFNKQKIMACLEKYCSHNSGVATRMKIVGAAAGWAPP